MKRIAALYILLFSVVALSAQNMLMKVTLADGAELTKQTDGSYVIDADKVADITFSVQPIANEPEAIDLDLPSGLKWASWDFGAEDNTAKGPLYKWDNFDINDIVIKEWTQYYDDKEWRMPTQDDFQELIDNCNWTLQDGKFKVASKTNADKFIILPIANYWSKTLTATTGFAVAMEVHSENTQGEIGLKAIATQLPIRPVWGLEKVTATVTVSVLSTSITYNSASVQVGVTCDDMTAIKSYGVKNATTGEILKTVTGQPSATNTLSLTGLSANTTYSIKGFVTMTDSRTFESAEAVSLTTKEKALAISASVSKADVDEATIAVTVTGDELSEEGVTYGLRWGDSADNLTNDVPGSASLTSGTAVDFSITGLEEKTTYYYQAYVKRGDEAEKTTTVADFTTASASGYATPGIVDLGLPSGIKWSSFNLGAKNDTEYGGHYGWGDATGENRATQSGYYGGNKIFTTIGGDPDYDIAKAKLGGNWRLPTCKEIEELIRAGHPTFIENYKNSGVNGWVFTGNNQSMFIPLAGVRQGADDTVIADQGRYAYLWSDSVATEGVYYTISTLVTQSVLNKARGLSIRPVYDDGTGSSGNGSSSTDPTNEVAERSTSETGLIPEAGIDMGTDGVKWARWNLGVTAKTGQYGRYYAWGETATKEQYTEATYNVPFKNQHYSNFTNMQFDSDYDVVKQLWGGKWRMPTAGEIAVLINNCNVEWTQEDGLSGYKLTSKTTGKSLFFPAGGWMRDSAAGKGSTGYYWSSSAYVSSTPEKAKGYATNMQFSEQSHPATNGFWRYVGMLIRPVVED